MHFSSKYPISCCINVEEVFLLLLEQSLTYFRFVSCFNSIRFTSRRESKIDFEEKGGKVNSRPRGVAEESRASMNQLSYGDIVSHIYENYLLIDFENHTADLGPVLVGTCLLQGLLFTIICP